MYSQRSLCGRLIVAAMAALGVACAAEPAAAQDAVATVTFVPANGGPPVPAGLKATCLRSPDHLQLSSTCPVVKYRGLTT